MPIANGCSALGGDKSSANQGDGSDWPEYTHGVITPPYATVVKTGPVFGAWPKFGAKTSSFAVVASAASMTLWAICPVERGSETVVAFV